jgi:methyl-accepting chemotaxis protein
MNSSKEFPLYKLRIMMITIGVISTSFILTTLTSTISIGLMHGIINTRFVFLRIIIESLSYGFLPGLIGGSVILFYLKPFSKAVTAVQKKELLAETDRELAIKRLSNIDKVILITNIAVYTVDFIFSLISRPFTIFEFFGFLVTLLVTAVIFSVIQINLINLVLSKSRSCLKIYHLNHDRKKPGLIVKNLMYILSLTLFVSMNFIAASQQIFMTESHYTHIINRVVSGEMTLDQARNLYKEEAAEMLMVKADQIHFPYDEKPGDEASPMRIYFIYLSQLLIIAGFMQYTNSLFQVRQIKDLQTKMQEIADGGGDLTRELEIFDDDEMGELTGIINNFLYGLRHLLRDVKDLGNKVRLSADTIKDVLHKTENSTQNIVSSNEQTVRSTSAQVIIADETTETIRELLKSVKAISDNVETQAAYVEETSSAINQMAANIQSVNQTTNNASKLSKDLVSVADDGGKAVNQSIVAVKKVEAFSDEINDMVSVITKISAQTNLLAMNAAIEAAHAGDSGKGFAVVATEVRNLAENSSDSAKQISSHIKEMVNLVNNGVELSEGAGQALGRVGDDVKRTSQLIQEVSAAMEEQAAGTNEVLSATTALVDSTHSIKEITVSQQEKNKEMTHAIEELNTSFRQIETAAKEQSRGTKEIQSSIEELKEVVLDNERATNSLDELLKGFIL